MVFFFIAQWLKHFALNYYIFIPLKTLHGIDFKNKIVYDHMY